MLLFYLPPPPLLSPKVFVTCYLQFSMDTPTPMLDRFEKRVLFTVLPSKMKNDLNYAAAWSRWERRHLARLHHYVDQPLIDALAKRVHGNKTVVDFCFGNGRLLSKLSRTFGRSTNLVGVDLNPFFLNRARRRFRRDSRISILPVSKFDSIASIDAIVSTLMLHLLPLNQLRSTLRKWIRSISKSGTIIAVIPHPVRMAKECNAVIKPGKSVKVDTSWDGAAETSYLRSASEYLRIFRKEGLKASTRTIPMNEEPYGYLLIVSHK